MTDLLCIAIVLVGVILVAVMVLMNDEIGEEPKCPQCLDEGATREGAWCWCVAGREKKAAVVSIKTDKEV